MNSGHKGVEPGDESLLRGSDRAGGRANSMKLSMTLACYRGEMGLQRDLTYTELVRGHHAELIWPQRQRPEFNYMGDSLFLQKSDEKAPFFKCGDESSHS